MVAPPSNLKQCQPILQYDPSNIWARLEQALQIVYEGFREACRAVGVDAYIGRSNLFEYPYSVFFECWLPNDPTDPALTDRVWAKVTLTPKPYHRFEIEYTIQTSNRGVEKKLGVFGALTAENIRALVEHLVERKQLPTITPKIRQPEERFAWFRTKKNKALATRADYRTKAGKWMIIAGVLGYFLASGASPDIQTPMFFFSTLSFVTGLIIAIVVRQQPTAVRSSGKSEREPRTLVLYDSWQAVLFGAAGSVPLMRTRFNAILRDAPIRGFRSGVENIQYRALDSVEEREQIVLTAGRGIIYCQLYEFGADLYVGWQSFLNRGRWIESPVSTGVDRATGKRVEVKTVVPGTQALSEYDVMDLNCLTEWTHAQLVSLTRQLMKELQIDQEIDFKIIRGERSALNEQAATAPEKKRRGAFRRTA